MKLHNNRYLACVLLVAAAAGFPGNDATARMQREAIYESSSPAPPQTAAPGATGRDCEREELDTRADCKQHKRVAPPKKTARETAPIDLTGYWVSVISEDWRWRMVTPPKTDFISLPLNDHGIRTIDQWDPKEPPNCKVFGAAGLMRNPLRVRFTWEDDNTVRAETDHGQQTRIFRFEPSSEPPGPRTMQGSSVAQWDNAAMKVVTTNMIAGYLRRNGAPYSENARLTEYYNTYSAFGEEWLTITTIVEDPTYLTREFNTSLDFKRLPDGASWNPTPCGVAQPAAAR